MTTIPRASRKRVAPEVAPRVELGRGSEAAFRAMEGTFRQVNDTIRPAVIEEQTAIGEKQAVDAIEKGTFEPAKPFSVRSRAFNNAADQIVTSRTMTELSARMDQAVRKADGNVGSINEELARIKADLGSGLPQLDGLQVDFQVAFDRGSSAAVRQTARIAEQRAIARARAAAAESAEALRSEAGFLALNGATPEEITASLADGQARLVQHGPRSEFTVGGVTYPADPNRMGTLSAAQVGGQLDAIQKEALGIQFEAGFNAADDKAGYMEAFQEELLAGKTPFSPGEGVEMLRVWGGRAYTQDQRRKAAEAAETTRLRSVAADQLSPYLAAGEAGVPIPIPEEQRAQVRASLAGDPVALREAESQMALADAYVDMAGLDPGQRLAYFNDMKAELIQTAATTGEIDRGKLAILEGLEDTIKKLQENVDASSVGLNMAERLVRDGWPYDPDDYEGMREAAGGDAELLQEISVVETLHKAQSEISSLPPEERELLIQQYEEQAMGIVSAGEARGSQMKNVEDVLEGLEDWSEKLTRMAERNPVAYAQQIGIPLASFEGAQSLGDAGQVILDRMQNVGPQLAAEGATEAVPMTDQEVQAISEFFVGSPPAEQLAFLGSLTGLDDDQALNIMERLGQSEPAMYHAGAIYAGGNTGAASMILRGSTDAQVEGGTKTDRVTARERVLGGALQANLVGEIEAIDAAALAYARGLAISEGGRVVTSRDLEDGYHVAMGRQADGTGGVANTRYGTTLLPAGWDEGQFARSLRDLSDEALEAQAGVVTDSFGGVYSSDDLFGGRLSGGLIEGMRPVPGEPTKFMPLGADGGFFFSETDEGRSVLIIDISELN